MTDEEARGGCERRRLDGGGASAPTPDLEDIRVAGLAAIAAAASLDDLDAARAGLVGRKGSLALLQRDLGALPAGERSQAGARLNAVRDQLLATEADRRATLEDVRDRDELAAQAIDVTLPARTPPRGSLHPIAETMEAMSDALVGLGYRIVHGPEVESDWFSFDALNMPADHPAKGLTDTIYVASLTPGLAAPDDAPTDTLLRPQTSPAQIRTLLAAPPPVYIAVPGRVFRADTADATHLPMFHQIEGLAVDTDLSFADLRGTLDVFVRALLGPDVEIRFRPHYFPFTEPSAEVDAYFESRWMELLGCGMVHPDVLRAVGCDPERVRGFAWGIGVDRMAMIRHGIGDLRLLVENDLRFLSAF